MECTAVDLERQRRETLQYARWLDEIGFDWFCTFTFRDTANDYRARRSAHIWFNRLHKVYRPALFFYVIEPHPLNPEAHHVHGLVKFGDSLISPLRKLGAEFWKWGWARILPVNGRASLYVCKYVVRKDVPDWDFLGDLGLAKADRGQIY